MDIENISFVFQAYDDKAKNDFDKKIEQLFRQFSSAIKLEAPYRLVLDSNILMRLENISQKTSPDFLAIQFFFNFLNFQSEFKTSILLRPTVFYEFFHQEDLKNEYDHWEKYSLLKQLIETELNVSVTTEGLSSFDLSQKNIANIKHDIGLIKTEIDKLDNQTWDYEFVRKFGEFDGFPLKDGTGVLTTPHFIAKEIAPTLNTKYFDSLIIKCCISHYIGLKISNNKKNKQDIVNKYVSETDFLLGRIIKINSSNRFMGIADLDLLSLCNIASQFRLQALDNYYPSSIPLTLDKNLFLSLNKLADLIIDSIFQGGEDGK